MANDTRSGRKNKDDGGNSSKKKSVDSKRSSTSGIGRTDSSESRKSACEPSFSPVGTRKSGRLEKQTPQTPPVMRKSERIEKQNSPSPLRRSERGKNSKHSMKGSTGAPNAKRKKEKGDKNLTQSTVESAKVHADIVESQESVGEKRKRITGRSYKALFQPQRRRGTTPDIADTLEGMDVLSEVEYGASQGIASKQMNHSEGKANDCVGEVVDETSEECLRSHSEEDTERSKSSLPRSVVGILETGGEVELSISRSRDSVTEESPVPQDLDGLQPTRTSSMVRETLNYAEKQDACSGWGTTCGECSRQRRVKHDSPKQELCDCNIKSKKDLDKNSCRKGREDAEETIMSEFAERLESSVQPERTSVDVQMDGLKKVCVICNQDEELLFCDGKGCEKCFHLSCLDPPLDDVPPGIWHCIWCVKKKLELGHHAVSEGVESVWDSREVEVSDSKGWQTQYLVKYQGLAHAHNHWVPETMLLSEVSSLVDEFKQKQQDLRWNSSWTVPHRLLKRRLIIFHRQQEGCNLRNGSIANCRYEWLVKWCDLGYEHATWELENAHFLQSSLGQKLVREFEMRRVKAKKVFDKIDKGPYVKLTKLPSGGSPIIDGSLLVNVNKLHEFWHKCQNAIVLNDQDRVRNAIFFILSITEIGCPFLVIATSKALSCWEAEFKRLAPSVDLVVYAGNKETRRSIRALEFYEEEGQMMLQVLLSSPEAVSEDLHVLRQLSWGTILIDECHPTICANFELVKMLSANSRVVLFASHLKETVADYLDVLSLLDSRILAGSLKSGSSETLSNLKERLSRFIAYSCKSESTKFIEYWVPVQLTNLQLEQYCATLLSNSAALYSCLKNDPVGALRDTLLTVRKCCDHPYMVDSSLLSSANGLPDPEILDRGTKASGKLQLLDMILSEIKARQQRVLVVFQSIAGSFGTSSLGHILEEFVHLRFGKNSYERVDACVVPSKKQATLTRFNSKEGKDSGQFIFLLEKRACLPSIKLSALDNIVLFDSDWNPGNDLRALQKISIDSRFQQIKVFRLYAACTAEEKLLIFAKQGVHLENYLQNTSRSNTDTLLGWGAFYLFNRLDEYHASQTSNADASSGEIHLRDVLKEFLAILTKGSTNEDTNDTVILRAQQSAGVYSTSCSLLGERMIQTTIVEEPHIFWRKLLEDRNPQWRHLCLQTPRSRKRVQHFDRSSRKPEIESDDLAKKRQKVVNDGVNLLPIQTDAAAGPAQVTHENQSLLGSTACGSGMIGLNRASKLNPHGTSASQGSNPEGPGERLISDEQKSLHIYLKAETAKLCELLALPEDVKHIVGRFLEYIMANHRVSKEPATILHALQISLCWIAASILKCKMDKEGSLMRAKQGLNFGCTVEQADSVYMKLRMFKKTFLQQPEVINDLLSLKHSTSAGDVAKESSDERDPESEATKQKNVKSGKEDTTQALEERSQDQKPVDRGILSEMEHVTEEIQEYLRTWEEKRLKLEKEYMIEAALLRVMRGPNKIDMLRGLETAFGKRLKELRHEKEVGLKDLKKKQFAARNEKRQISDKGLPEMGRSGSECGTSDEVQMAASVSRNVGRLQSTAHATCNGVVQNCSSLSGQLGEEHTSKEMVNDLLAGDAAMPFGAVFSVSKSLLSDKEPDEVCHVGSDEFVSAKHPTPGGEPHNMTSSGVQNEFVSANSPEAASREVTCTHDADANVAAVQFNEDAERGDRIDSDMPECLGNQREKAEISIIGNIPSKQSSGDLVAESHDTLVHSLSVSLNHAPQDGSPQRVMCTEAQDCEDRAHQGRCRMSTEMQNADQLVTANQSNLEADDEPSSVAHAGPTTQSNYESSAERLEPVFASSSPGGSRSQIRGGADQVCGDGSIPFQVPESTNLVGEIDSSCQNMGSPSTDVTNPEVCDNCPDLQPISCIHFESAGGSSITAQEVSVPSHADSHTAEQNHAVPSNLDSHTAEPQNHAVPSNVDIPFQTSQTTNLVGEQELSNQILPETGKNMGTLSTDVTDPNICDSQPDLRPSNCIHREPDGGLSITSQEAGVPSHVDSHTAEPQNHTVPSHVDIPFQTSQSTNLVGEPEISNQVPPETGENMGTLSTDDVANPNICDSQPDLRPSNCIHRESDFGLSTTSQEVGVPSHVDSHIAEPPNRAVPGPGSNVNNARAPVDHPVQPAPQMNLHNPPQSSHTDPLQNELEKLRKATEQAIKGHEDMKSRLRSDCEKEIAEVVTQIRKKYETKIQDAEAVFMLRKSELDTALNKVFLNKILADAFRSKCLRPSGPSELEQVMHPSSMQLHQLSSQSMLRSSPIAVTSSAGRPPATQQNTALTVLAGRPATQLNTASTVSAGRPPAIQQNTASTVPAGRPATQQNAASTVSAGRPPATQQNTAATVPAGRPPATQQNTAATVPAGPRPAAVPAAVPRPLHIGSITPSTASTRVGGEFRAPAPHLQPFRQPASAPPHLPPTSLSSLPHSMPCQQILAPSSSSLLQLLPSQPSELPSRLVSQPTSLLPPHSQVNQSGSEIRPTDLPNGLTATQRTHPSAVELLMDIHRQSHARQSNTLPPLADSGSNFNSVDQSDLATPSRVQDSLTTSAPPTNVVCLSDDD